MPDIGVKLKVLDNKEATAALSGILRALGELHGPEFIARAFDYMFDAFEQFDEDFCEGAEGAGQ